MKLKKISILRSNIVPGKSFGTGSDESLSSDQVTTIAQTVRGMEGDVSMVIYIQSSYTYIRIYMYIGMHSVDVIRPDPACSRM